MRVRFLLTVAVLSLGGVPDCLGNCPSGQAPDASMGGMCMPVKTEEAPREPAIAPPPPAVEATPPTGAGPTALAVPNPRAGGGELAGSRGPLGGLNVQPNTVGAQWLLGARGEFERFRALPPAQKWQFVHDRLEKRLEELKKDDNPAVRQVAENIHGEMDVFATEKLGPKWKDAEAAKNRPPAEPQVYDTLLKTAFGMRVITQGAARIDELRERKDQDGARMSKDEFAALVQEAEKARKAMDRVMGDPNNLPLVIHDRLMADEGYKHNITKPLKQIGYQMGEHIGWMQQSIDSPGVNTGAAQYHAGNKDWARAEQAADRALDQQPDNPAALTVRAQARYEQGNYAGALADGRAALRLDPSNENARGVVQFAANRLGPEMAAPKASNPFAGQGEGAQLGGASTTGPVPIEATAEARQSAAFVNEAARLFKIGDYGAARAALDKAIEINPANADAHAKRAWLNAAEGRAADALASVKSALRLDPRRGPSMATKLASELNRQGRYAEARDVLSLLRPEQRDANSWFQLARAHNGLGERDAMMASLRRAAELDPANFAGRYQQAMSAGVDEDLSFLFGDAPAPGTGGRAGGKRGSPRDRMLWTYLAVIAGGFLVALGLLHVVGGQWTRRVTTRLRSSFGRAEADAGVETDGLESEGEGEASATRIAGNYDLVRQIGLGGMGIVYECVDRSLGRKVAVKKMREEIRVDPRERERFITEARTVASLRHPNIVEIHSIVEHGSDIFLVFEFVDGTTLYELLDRRGRLPLQEAQRIVEQAGEALAYAHKRDVIHRDLKPSNIMIAEGGAVKVMDFGVARQAKDAVSKLSMTNTIVGTPPYMAPEQEQGLVCKESDVYALAVCHYELVTGRLPFQGTGAGMLLNKMNKSYAPPSTLAPELPSALDEVFAKAFEPDPARRFRGVGEFLAALRGVRA